MKVIPSIDLSDGMAVKRVRGSLEVIRRDPWEVARDLCKYPISRVHLVDLDGAGLGRPVNRELIKDLSLYLLDRGLEVQAGGGIRTLEDARWLSNLGVDVILGTIVYENERAFRRIVDGVGGGKVIAAVDIRGDRVLGWGWKRELTDIERALEVLKGLKRAIVTNVEVEGTLSGAKIEEELIRALKKVVREVMYAGGVSPGDLPRLSLLGVDYVIIGMSYYVGKLGDLLHEASKGKS